VAAPDALRRCGSRPLLRLRSARVAMAMGRPCGDMFSGRAVSLLVRPVGFGWLRPEVPMSPLRIVAAFDFDGTLTTKDSLRDFVRYTVGNVRFNAGDPGASLANRRAVGNL
jgi:hypothetical protein